MAEGPFIIELVGGPRDGARLILTLPASGPPPDLLFPWTTDPLTLWAEKHDVPLTTEMNAGMRQLRYVRTARERDGFLLYEYFA